jgi:hypothetical protein
MSTFDNFLRQFGINEMPWAIRVYLALFLICIGVLIFVAMQIGLRGDLPDAHPLNRLFGLAQDGFKTVLGALIGALSVASGQRPAGRSGQQQRAEKDRPVER